MGGEYNFSGREGMLRDQSFEHLPQFYVTFL